MLSSASSEWPKPTPMLRWALESVRSRCRRLVTSVAASESSTRARELEVRLGVLEADRVDLVRHRRRAGGAGLRDLAEVAERDVRPDVGREVVQHAVGVGDARVELGLPVVRLDLGGERVPGEAERLDELARDVGPRDIRSRDDVRRERAGRARELAEVLGGLDLPRDALEAVARRPRAPCPWSTASRAGRGCARASRRRGARRARAARVSMTPRYFGSQTSRTASRTVIA